jgi:hypothetical protein
VAWFALVFLFIFLGANACVKSVKLSLTVLSARHCSGKTSLAIK